MAADQPTRRRSRKRKRRNGALAPAPACIPAAAAVAVTVAVLFLGGVPPTASLVFPPPACAVAIPSAQPPPYGSWQREVALQKHIESTAIARISRAARGITSPAGEALNYQPGELLEFHRPPRSKDTPAWRGPAKVLRNEPERGMVVVQWRGEEVRCRYPDVRRFIEFPALVFGALSTPGAPQHEAWQVLTDYIARMPDRRYETLGYAYSGGVWRPTVASKQNARAALAASFIVRNILCTPGAFAIRIGRNVSRFPAHAGATSCVLFWWQHGRQDMGQCTIPDLVPSVETKELVGDKWPNTFFLQVLLNSDEIDMTQLMEPE